jgi:hypothetical protein
VPFSPSRGTVLAFWSNPIPQYERVRSFTCSRHILVFFKKCKLSLTPYFSSLCKRYGDKDKSFFTLLFAWLGVVAKSPPIADVLSIRLYKIGGVRLIYDIAYSHSINFDYQRNRAVSDLHFHGKQQF